MKPLHFIFQEDTWIGEGKIAFASSPETVRFFTRWQLVDKTDDGFIWLHEVELHGLDQTNRNIFTFSQVTDKSFHLTLANETMGQVSGKGVITPESIAWELRNVSDSEGYEVYERQANGEYIFRSEYVSLDPYRTVIEGKIWKKI